jgi:probable rRNA maturation factor
MINIINLQKKVTIPEGLCRLLRRYCYGSLWYEEIFADTEITIIFTDNEYIKKLNRKTRGIDKATDVLSFPMYTDHDLDDKIVQGRYNLGDMFINLEWVNDLHLNCGKNFNDEVLLLAVHSMLHLLGYDHENLLTRKVMFGIQRKILKKCKNMTA